MNNTVAIMLKAFLIGPTIRSPHSSGISTQSQTLANYAFRAPQMESPSSWDLYSSDILRALHGELTQATHFYYERAAYGAQYSTCVCQKR